MAHPNRSKRRGNAKSGPITKTDLFNMGNIVTGGNLGIARNVFNTFSGWNNKGSGGSSLQTKSKKLKTK